MRAGDKWRTFRSLPEERKPGLTEAEAGTKAVASLHLLQGRLGRWRWPGLCIACAYPSSPSQTPQEMPQLHLLAPQSQMSPKGEQVTEPRGRESCRTNLSPGSLLFQAAQDPDQWSLPCATAQPSLPRPAECPAGTRNCPESEQEAASCGFAPVPKSGIAHCQGGPSQNLARARKPCVGLGFFPHLRPPLPGRLEGPATQMS